MRFAGVTTARGGRTAPATLALVLTLALAALGMAPSVAHAQRLPPDAAILDGFSRVVFGAEFRGVFSDDTYLKRFAAPVRFRVENRAAIDRTAAVRGFVRQIGRSVAGLEAGMAGRDEPANFVVHVVDRAAYQRTGREIYRNPFMRVPGNCIVRAVYGRAGISHADAILVSDEGEPLFRRCLVEEILQGLGPLNDDADAPQSVFNDTSRLTTFGPYDRLILNMLYDARLQPGMSMAAAKPLLPKVLADTKRRLRLR